MNIEEVKRRYLELSVRRFLIIKQIQDINNLFIDDLKSRGIVPSIYSCQTCGFNEVVTETEVDIFLGESPRCHGCLGNVSVGDAAIKEYIDSHWKGGEEDVYNL